MKMMTAFFAALSSLFSGCTEKDKPTAQDTSSAAPTAAPASVAMDSSVAKASGPNELAWSLYRAIGKKDGQNVFISPASLTTAVALAFEGSSGPTRAKAKAFLSLESHTTDNLVPNVYQSFKNSGPAIKLQIENAMWADPAMIVPTPAFIKRADQLYSAKVTSQTFGDGIRISEDINKWVKIATHDMIEKMVQPSDLSGHHLAVANAVYFLGTWQQPFEVFRTSTDDFKREDGTKVPTPLMNRTDTFAYANHSNYLLIHLPYKNPDYVMSIILPKAGTKLSDLEKTVTAGAFEDAGESQQIWVTLPKFKIEWGVQNVIDQLKELGLPTAIPKADFAQLGAKDEVIIDAVLHKAVIKVDETGTEAAAATVIGAYGAGAPKAPPRFQCDHPFLFAIRDAKRNEILFMGRFTRP